MVQVGHFSSQWWCFFGFGGLCLVLLLFVGLFDVV